MPEPLTRTQRMRLLVPVVEVADDADARGVRRPHAEHHAARHDVAAELLPQLVMRPFVEEVNVPVGQQRLRALL